MLQLQAGSRALLHYKCLGWGACWGMWGQLRWLGWGPNCDEHGDMNPSTWWTHLQICCSTLLQGVACPTGHEGFQVLSQGRTESITYIWNPFFCCFSGWGKHGVRMDVFVCLLAYFFSSPFDDNLSGEFGLPSWVFAQFFLSIMALIASYE